MREIRIECPQHHAHLFDVVVDCPAPHTNLREERILAVFLFFPIAITSNWVPSGKEADVRLIGTLRREEGRGTHHHHQKSQEGATKNEGNKGDEADYEMRWGRGGGGGNAGTRRTSSSSRRIPGNVINLPYSFSTTIQIIVNRPTSSTFCAHFFMANEASAFGEKVEKEIWMDFWEKLRETDDAFHA
jgi:hypothetical protein